MQTKLWFHRSQNLIKSQPVFITHKNPQSFHSSPSQKRKDGEVLEFPEKRSVCLKWICCFVSRLSQHIYYSLLFYFSVWCTYCHWLRLRLSCNGENYVCCPDTLAASVSCFFFLLFWLFWRLIVLWLISFIGLSVSPADYSCLQWCWQCVPSLENVRLLL